MLFLKLFNGLPQELHRYGFTSILAFFRMLEALYLCKFLSCGLYSKDVMEQFFSTATVEHGIVLCSFGEANFFFSQKSFAETF